MPARDGERVRLVQVTAAPQGWHPANFLSATYGTALCLVHARLEDDVWGWCAAFQQRQVSYVTISKLGGTGEFILEEPVVPAESGSDWGEAKQDQWSEMLELCFHYVVAPTLILAAGPNSDARLAATCMLPCDVLNGTRENQIIRVFD